MKKEVTKEQIHSFLNGRNPMERIIKIEGGYNDDKMAVIYRDENGIKKVYAIDVGTDQFDKNLNPRTTSVKLNNKKITFDVRGLFQKQ